MWIAYRGNYKKSMKTQDYFVTYLFHKRNKQISYMLRYQINFIITQTLESVYCKCQWKMHIKNMVKTPSDIRNFEYKRMIVVNLWTRCGYFQGKLAHSLSPLIVPLPSVEMVFPVLGSTRIKVGIPLMPYLPDRSSCRGKISWSSSTWEQLCVWHTTFLYERLYV